MLRKRFPILFAMMLTALALAAAEAPLRPIGPALSSLTWKPVGEYSRLETIEGRRILVTDVPQGKAAGTHGFERELDLTPYRGRIVTFFVRFRCTEVSKPPQSYQGVKFMLSYQPGAKEAMQYPGSNGTFGSTDGWKTLAFNVTFRNTVQSGRLSLGLQESSGRIEFDLDSLQAGLQFSEAVEKADPMLPAHFLPGDETPETFQFQGIPSIEVTPGGNRYATWFAGTKEAAYTIVKVARSTPQNPGKWKVVMRVVHPGIRLFEPLLWNDSSGKLHLSWAQSRCNGFAGTDGVNGVWHSVCADPDAPSPVWSEPRRICDGVMANKPVMAKNGDWLLPVSIWGDGVDATVQPAPERVNALRGANLFVSTDGGKSFTRRGRARVEDGARIFDEHCIVERRDGSLLMLIRTRYGIAESVSTDGGWNWSTPRRSQLRGPNSRFALRRLQSGALLLVNHRCDGTGFSPHRRNLTAFLSDDDGASWSSGMLIDPGWVSYPNFIQQDDGTILCVYDHNREGVGEILLAEFTEAEVRAGKLAHPPHVIYALRPGLCQCCRENRQKVFKSLWPDAGADKAEQ